MPQYLGYRYNVRAVGDCHTGESMPQLVRVEVVNAVFFAILPKVCCRSLRIHWGDVATLREDVFRLRDFIDFQRSMFLDKSLFPSLCIFLLFSVQFLEQSH